MASVLLDRVILTDAADLSDSIAFYSDDRGDSRTRDGAFKTYAGGRVRLVTTPTRTRTLTLRAVDVTPAQVAWLDEHTGTTVLLRDKKGRRVWGSYLSVSEVDRLAQTKQDVALTFVQTTYSDAK